MGSVFSPYYHWSGGGKGAGDPENHVCINVALYGPGGRWAMTERSRRALSRGGDHFTVGPSGMVWQDGRLTVEIDEVAAPWPRRVRGRVRLTPEVTTSRAYGLDGAGRHHWHPLAPEARVEVEMTRPGLSWSGHGYLDTNWGAEPIADGFRRWDWSRTRLGDGSAVLYDMRLRDGGARQLALRLDRQGRVEAFQPPPRQRLPRGLWQVSRQVQAEAPGARIVRGLEDAPFYTRSELETHLFGERAPAVHETLDCDRLRMGLVKCMLPVRMPRVWW